MVPFGILATLVSSLYQIANNPVNPLGCAASYVNRGFPLSWYSTYYFVGSHCTILLIPANNPIINMVSFLLDVVFYVAAGIAIIQLYRGAVEKIPSTTSARVNKIV
jgi:hypothetical protein